MNEPKVATNCARLTVLGPQGLGPEGGVGGGARGAEGAPPLRGPQPATALRRGQPPDSRRGFGHQRRIGGRAPLRLIVHRLSATQETKSSSRMLSRLVRAAQAICSGIPVHQGAEEG